MKILEAAGGLKKIDENCASQKNSWEYRIGWGVECKYEEIVSGVAPDGRKAGGKWSSRKWVKWVNGGKWVGTRPPP